MPSIIRDCAIIIGRGVLRSRRGGSKVKLKGWLGEDRSFTKNAYRRNCNSKIVKIFN